MDGLPNSQIHGDRANKRKQLKINNIELGRDIGEGHSDNSEDEGRHRQTTRDGRGKRPAGGCVKVNHSTRKHQGMDAAPQHTARLLPWRPAPRATIGRQWL